MTLKQWLAGVMEEARSAGAGLGPGVSTGDGSDPFSIEDERRRRGATESRRDLRPMMGRALTAPVDTLVTLSAERSDQNFQMADQPSRRSAESRDGLIPAPVLEVEICKVER